MNDDRPTDPTSSTTPSSRHSSSGSQKRRHIHTRPVLTPHDRDYIDSVVAGGPLVRLKTPPVLPLTSHHMPDRDRNDLARFNAPHVRHLLTALIAAHHPERLPELRRLAASLVFDDALLGKGRTSRARLALEALKLDKAAEAASVAAKARTAAKKADPPINGSTTGREPRSLS